jgi:hypothetical protein
LGCLLALDKTQAICYSITPKHILAISQNHPLL